MLETLLIAANSFISICYFIIAFLILMPFLRGQQKTSLVLATISVFFSCGLGHGGHVLMMVSSSNQHSLLLKFQVGVDLITAGIAITYIALRRYYSFLVDAPLLLNQAQDKLEFANAELKNINAKLEFKASQLEATLHELRHTQAQLIQNEKMSALGQLVAGIAHEINNPVNFIYGNITHVTQYIQGLMDLLICYRHEYPNTTLLLQNKVEPIDIEFIITDLPKLLSSIKVGTQRIRDIVLSLRTFSRLDEASMKAVNLHEGIESTLLILQSRLKTKAGIEIQVIKNYSELPKIECYPGQLNQVFMNILCNAIDALEITSDKSKPIIQIRTELNEQKRVVIAIADNGQGIPESIGARIFDPFFTTKPVGQGTGLGLSTSYQIVVDKHRGNIKFTSVTGKTEFLIEIPLNQS
ncbi:hypothetical protein CAL7716_073360 [Calothrix sp. PCC 7716]|nr:hypothetical protein CAL7716_073360 [Calothrix sp. PCC 7716]